MEDDQIKSLYREVEWVFRRLQTPQAIDCLLVVSGALMARFAHPEMLTTLWEAVLAAEGLPDTPDTLPDHEFPAAHAAKRLCLALLDDETLLGRLSAGLVQWATLAYFGRQYKDLRAVAEASAQAGISFAAACIARAEQDATSKAAN